MKKHIHKIVINGNKKYTHKYTYKFGNTNDISIELSKDSLCITAELTKIYDKNEMISQDCYLFPDAIKKALTLHLILFSKNVTIKTMTVQIDDENAIICRLKAIEYLNSIIESADEDEQANFELIKADMLRRSNKFEELITEFANKHYKDDILNKIISFQIVKAREKDNSCYTVENTQIL